MKNSFPVGRFEPGTFRYLDEHATIASLGGLCSLPTNYNQSLIGVAPKLDGLECVLFTIRLVGQHEVGGANTLSVIFFFKLPILIRNK